MSLPSVAPTALWFPDKWTPDEEGVARIARRLLGYAGLGELEVSVSIWSDTPEEYRRPSAALALPMHREGAVAGFLGIEGGVVRFQIEEGQLSDPEGIPALMAHEVAHAWRAANGEAASTHEELNTDVTTVFLGFGILTTNGAYRYRQGGGYGWSEWSTSRLGYLPPESMAFLLAAQAVARGASWRERRAIAAHLEANQASAFRRACRSLEQEGMALRRRLGGPADGRHARLPPGAEEAPRAGQVPVAHRPPAPGPRWNLGRPVFRVARAKWMVVAGQPMLGAAVGLIASLIPAEALRERIQPSAVLVAGLAAGAAVGLFTGLRAARRRWDVCSDPDCQGEIPPARLECPKCGGTIAGRLRCPEDRLRAEEEQRLVPEPRRRPRSLALVATVCLLGVLVGRCAGVRPSRIFKSGPVLADMGCEYGRLLASRCVPGDRLGFRIGHVRGPLYLAAALSRMGSSERVWLFPDDDGSVPDIGRSTASDYTLYVGIPELPPGDYQLLAMLFPHVPTKAEVESGGGRALDRDEVTLSVSKDHAPGGRVRVLEEAPRAKPPTR